MILRTMKEQTLNQEFDFYYNMLSEVQKRSLLSMMKSFIGGKENTKRVSIAQYNRELEAAEERINRGQFVTQDSLRKEAEKW
jgi:hypothetical protein